MLIKVLRYNLLTQLIDIPTRARDPDTPHILDLVIMNNFFVESVKHFAPLGKSDYVVLDIACNSSINVPEVKQKLNFSKGNLENYVILIGTILLIPLTTQLMKCGIYFINISLILLNYIYLSYMILGHGKSINGKDD